MDKKLLIFGLTLIFSGAVLTVKHTGQIEKLSREGNIRGKSSTSIDQSRSEVAGTVSEEELILVKRVVDGDTIVFENREVARYIGIDTPENSQKDDCFVKESTNKNKELVEGKKVRLEKDISERDKYQRLLRYVYVGDLFVNDYLVRNGYAKVSTYPPDVRYQQQFIESEKYARENNLGLWSKCNRTTPLRSDVVNPTASGGKEMVEQSDINCVSNTYNCSDFQTQAEAQKVFEACGGTSNDVHRLDRDADGRVCESLP